MTRKITGSSPHMRGTLYLLKAACAVLRFIPAHAGNTSRDLVTAAQMAVHPRTCGEHLTGPEKVQNSTGSSPHMRGTPESHAANVTLVRFIPAHAGNTTGKPAVCVPGSVHPRTCGEHTFCGVSFLPIIGSSPHMRGTHKQVGNVAGQRRFIPAHAGNTPSSAWQFCQAPVHPRTCGEHDLPGHKSACDVGSSPHMRGTLFLARY